MASIDFAALIGPAAEGGPCGPDLDAAGDADFMHLLARAEGILPSTFFMRNPREPDAPSSPFRWASLTEVDYNAELRNIAKLLETTRDLRLLTLLAKFLILDRDLEGFAAGLDTIAALLETYWPDVHPRGENDDFGLRQVVLQSLEDTPTVILPLQHVPLASSRRAGVLTYRAYMIATGAIKAREGEDATSLSAIDSVLTHADLPGLIVARDQINLARGALGRIEAASLQHGGHRNAVKFETLGPLVQSIFVLLDGAVVKQDPSAGAAPSPPSDPSGTAVQAGVDAVSGVGLPSAASQGDIRSTKHAAEALAAAAAYFARTEPSSPALLLVCQAEQLIGKSFQQVMQILLPTHADNASIQIGTAQQAFNLPVERLSTLAAPADDEDGMGALDGTEERSPESAAASSDDVLSAPPLRAASRREALALLRQVSGFYRATEPSSPIPLLTDRACELAERDFMSLLNDILPEISIRTPEE
jgi:type VI secretion system protein ImpA